MLILVVHMLHAITISIQLHYMEYILLLVVHMLHAITITISILYVHGILVIVNCK
jgi:hypothetical protein